ncbi:hypothetical protein H072_765 [Dactylellina haptotyla CBS 200.50]|uniref:Phosphatidylserine decarboxylase proenzyme 2 n=1 Tax=Dactylellina haptotyla (strain CBS 200.50) TaxID=1284197 RepID=S8CBZ9_DACHA|nr:hypothetical protein H072_765 [Dactylellina haptotyla CBS 200.50]
MTDISDLVLKVTIVEGRDLAAKDRSGKSDPYVVVNLDGYRNVTHAVPKSLNPAWNITFDIPVSKTGSHDLHCICWDKDRFGKDYMGEFEVPLDEYFSSGASEITSRWFQLVSTKKKAKISGEIQLDLALFEKSGKPASIEQILSIFKGSPSIAGTPMLEFENPAGLGVDMGSDDDMSDEDDDTADEGIEATGSSKQDTDEKEKKKKKKKKSLKLKTKAKKMRKKKPVNSYEFANSSDVVGVMFIEISSCTDLPPEKNMTRTSFDCDPFVVVSLGKKTYRTRVIRHCLDPKFDEKMVFQVLRHEQNYSLNFAVVDKDKFSGNDFIAQVDLPVQDVIATAPKSKGDYGLYEMPDFSTYDMSNSSPSNGNKSRFRLPLSRSSSATNLSKKNRPELSSKHTTSSSSLYQMTSKLAVPEALSTKDGQLAPPTAAIPPGPPTPTNEDIPAAQADANEYDLKVFDLTLLLKNKERWEGKHSPELHIRAKYIPYPALRQQFWRVMLRQYDADDSGMISRVELTTMLDSLGSTLKASTIDGFFERFAEENGISIENCLARELTMDQVVICLEDQLAATSKSTNNGYSPYNHSSPSLGKDEPSTDTASTKSADTNSDSYTPAIQSKSQSTYSLSQTLTPTIPVPGMGASGEEGANLSNDGLADDDDEREEHVIVVKECPLCHQPRLQKRSEVDIVTHLATCASQDWRRVDRLVMGGFVTSSQAQRKWYSKVITKVSYGGYKLGANSANILVQDRITGLISEERMSVYVRLGIRLLYKGLKSSSMEKKKIRQLLESLSWKQGKKYDNPASAREIKPFIAFHQLNVNEVLKPLEEFKTFNEFFYRELKPGARPIAYPDNPKVIVSPADCRSVVFDTIDDATKIWVKGRDFSIERLLGSAYGNEAKKYHGGALGVFRLAPQDYHRFHIPVDGVMGEPRLIKGEYYTVNPMAIRSALDVYGENVRIIVPFDSVSHGRVMVVCVGAMMVGSTVITAKSGAKFARGDELGYFKFGGSTLVVLFEPNTMKWDDDLVANSKEAVETLIRVGMSVGHSPDQREVGHETISKNVTAADKADAKRRVEGSLAPPRTD